MKSISKYFHCENSLISTFKEMLDELSYCVENVEWAAEFSDTSRNGIEIWHQRAYNRAFEKEFLALGWESQPLLLEKPKLIGDFRKDMAFVEMQFGNSSTLYRDYYKFQYGLAHGLLSLAVLIVPTTPASFFPTRPDSVNNMAEFILADRYFTVLPLHVPTLLIGLLPEN